MKFFTLFAACMLMVLSVYAAEVSESKKACPNTAATFDQCIRQYGGWSPEETVCQSKATLGDEYNRCLATSYYNLSQCFNHCPNHPRKANYDLYFQQYQSYYTAPPVQQVEQPTAGVDGQGATIDPITGTTQTGNGSINLEENTSNGTMLNAFSLGAILCMVAYWIF